jgi:hypothetical protein
VWHPIWHQSDRATELSEAVEDGVIASAPQYFFHRPQQINIRVLRFGELRDTRLPCSKHRLWFGEPVLNNGVYLTLHALYKKGGNTWDRVTKQGQVHTCLLGGVGVLGLKWARPRLLDLAGAA